MTLQYTAPQPHFLTQIRDRSGNIVLKVNYDPVTELLIQSYTSGRRGQIKALLTTPVWKLYPLVV